MAITKNLEHLYVLARMAKTEKDNPMAYGSPNRSRRRVKTHAEHAADEARLDTLREVIYFMDNRVTTVSEIDLYIADPNA